MMIDANEEEITREHSEATIYKENQYNGEEST